MFDLAIRGNQADLLRRTLQDALRTLGISFAVPRSDGLHLLRRTSGSLVYHRTADVKRTQEWLGHTSSRVTMDTYVHLMSESQKQTAEAVFSRAAQPQPGGEPAHQTERLVH